MCRATIILHIIFHYCSVTQWSRTILQSLTMSTSWHVSSSATLTQWSSKNHSMYLFNSRFQSMLCMYNHVYKISIVIVSVYVHPKLSYMELYFCGACVLIAIYNIHMYLCPILPSGTAMVTSCAVRCWCFCQVCPRLRLCRIS